MEGVQGLEESRAAYLTAAAYFKGEIAERFASARIRALVQESGQAYRFRLAAVPVRVMTNRCRIAGITGGNDAVTKRIEEIRQANGMELAEQFIHRETFTYGDAYALVWPVEAPEEGTPSEGSPDAELVAAGVEIVYQSPLAVRAVYDSGAGRRVRFVIRRWQETSALGFKTWHAEVWYPDRVEPWVTLPDHTGLDKEDWLPYAESVDGYAVEAVEGENWPVPHDWEEIPFKHARTDLPYGLPAHIDAYGPQDMITKATVTQMMDIEAHGWPERYRLLDDQKILEAAMDSVRWDDATEAQESKAGVTKSGRTRGAAREQTYAGTREVGEFKAPDPNVLIEPIEQWLRLMSTTTGIPLYEYDARTSKELSGIARDKADGPLKEKVKDAKTYLEDFWRSVWELALKMDGVGNPGQIDLLWAPPEVIADPEWWETAQLRQEMGVPQRQILLEANYLPEDVDKWLKDQSDGMALAAQVQLLERIGAAVQALGSGVAVGLMSVEAAAAAIERVTGIPATNLPPALPPAPRPGQENLDEEEEDKPKDPAGDEE